MADVGSKRPLSPHVLIYRPQLSWVPSIVNRMTGVANAVGLLLLSWGLVALASGSDAYAGFHGFIGSRAGMLMLFGWTWSICYHALNGIRHLVWDTGIGFDIETMDRSAMAVVGGSMILTVLIWIVA